LGKFVKRSSIFILGFLFVAGVIAAAAQQFDSAAEQEIFRLVNADRAQAGLPPLELDARLTAIARKHTEEMARKQTLAHQFPDEPDVRHRVIASGVRFEMSGENVANSRDADSAERALMNSPPHRANILRRQFNAIGIGVIHAGDSIYVTQDFAQRLQEFTPTQAENAVSQAFEQLRRQSGAPLLPRVRQPNLRQLACDMARNDRLETDLARDIANVRGVVVWTASDPQKLPADLLKLNKTTASGWSVGACFASSQHYQNPVWWMVAVTYF
jgi:hypothetical protein